MIDILMPRLSDTMTEGAIATWHKKPGDTVAAGDILLEIETDKALMEQEAYVSGTLAEILVPEGANVAIGTPIARLDDGVDHGEDAGTPSVADSTLEPEPAPAPVPVPVRSEGERRAATPLVRRLAKERGVDLGTVAGTGPGGRVVRADLEAAAARAPETPAAVAFSRPPESDATRVPFDGIRRQIAARLTESATTVPVFHATASADVTRLLSLRTRINETAAAADVKVSVNDLIVKAVALALHEHPAINASYSPDGGGQTLQHERIDVGVAVAAPAGLVVPVVREAAASSITTIARRTRELATRAVERTLTTADMGGGTFTVSNLGMFGVEQFTAIINPPQGAILAVGAVSDEVVLVEGEVAVRRRLRYTLSADHRIIDGADAGRFLATLTTLLEEPMRLLL